MKDSFNLILWGASYDYDRYFHYIELEKRKGNISIEGIALNEENFAQEIDGIPVIEPNQIRNMFYDYIVVLTKDTFSMVLQIAPILQIPREKIITVELFQLPLFDFVRWNEVRTRKVSLLSNHCWGGMTYEALQMPFYSPLVGMYESDEDYIKLLGNLKHYLTCPLECLEWIAVGDKQYPVVQCDDIVLRMNHHFGEWEQIVGKWKRRSARLQESQIFATMYVNDKKILEAFLDLPYKNKLAFTTIYSEDNQVIWMDIEYLEKKYGKNKFNGPLEQAVIGRREFTRYDILGYLLGERTYKRIR